MLPCRGGPESLTCEYGLAGPSAIVCHIVCQPFGKGAAVSIWCSWEDIGWNPGGRYHYDDGRVVNEPGRFDRGRALSYAQGFSNHHPDETGEHEAPATIGVAHIAPWCVPGHFEDCDCGGHDYPECGEWLRLSVDAPGALSWWTKPGEDKPRREPVHADVLLDEQAARALAADLLKWADMPKVRPVPA